MKTKLFFFVSLLFLTASCSNDEDNAPAPEADPLEATGLLGVWEFQGRTVNGEDTGAEPCCIFLEFVVNANPNDTQGTYFRYGSVPMTEGIFIVSNDGSNDLVEFTNFGDDNIYTYTTTSTQLTLSRTKGTSLEVETYIKRD